MRALVYKVTDENGKEFETKSYERTLEKDVVKVVTELIDIPEDTFKFEKVDGKWKVVKRDVEALI